VTFAKETKLCLRQIERFKISVINYTELNGIQPTKPYLGCKARNKIFVKTKQAGNSP
jgi:hypothetical protein